jgi:NADH:ubiquinone oxidoreductase subunit 6 (subunit J)
LDTTLTIIFYVCSGLAIAGSLAATLAPVRWLGLSLVAVAVGTAAALASLSAGFAALLALVALGACALLLRMLPVDGGDRPARPVRNVPGRPGPATVLGAVTPLLLLAALLYAAWRGSFAAGQYPGGWFGAAALGRAFFGRDAIALDAVAAMLLVGLAGGAMLRGRR